MAKKGKTKTIPLRAGQENPNLSFQIWTEVSNQATCFRDVKAVRIGSGDTEFQTKLELFNLSCQIVPHNNGQKFQMKNTIFLIIGPNQTEVHPDLLVRLVNKHEFNIAVLFNPSVIKTLAVLPLKKGVRLDDQYSIMYPNDCLLNEKGPQPAKLPTLIFGKNDPTSA